MALPKIFQDKQKIVVLAIITVISILMALFIIYLFSSTPSKGKKSKVSDISVESSDPEEYRQKIEDKDIKQQQQKPQKAGSDLEQQVVDEQQEKERLEKAGKKERIDPLQVAVSRPVEVKDKKIIIKPTPAELYVESDLWKGEGGLLAEEKEKEKKNSKFTGGEIDKAGDKKDIVKITYFKPYPAMLMTPLDSRYKYTNAIVEIVSGDLRHHKLVSNVDYNSKDEKFYLTGHTLVLPGEEQLTQEVNAEVLSVDETPGAISAVRHDDVPWLAGAIALDGLSIGLKAYVDRNSNTTIIVPGGRLPADDQKPNSNDNRYYGDSIIIQRDKSNNPTKDALASGGSAALSSLGGYVKGRIRGEPTGLASKGTPVYVVFYPVQQRQSKPER